MREIIAGPTDVSRERGARNPASQAALRPFVRPLQSRLEPPGRTAVQPLVPPDLPTVEHAWDRIVGACAPLGAERLPIERCAGRFLAEPVMAAEDSPAFDLSQMDGYALRFANARAARSDAPVRLAVRGRVAAGDPPPPPLAPGEAVRIFTGAPLPVGADVVVPQEWTRPVDDDGGCVWIERVPAAPGGFVRRRASDLRAGETVLVAGERLRPGRLALAAACGRAALQVGRRPRVALIATGSELLPPGAPGRAGAVRESNRLLLRPSLEAAGARIIDFGIVGDAPEALAQRIAAARACADLVVTTGGVSVGEADHVKAVAERLGFERVLWRLRLRPGKPLYAARCERRGGPPVWLLGLPGNPGSVLTTLWLFVLPVVRALQGARDPAPCRIAARLAAPVEIPAGRRTYLRATREVDAAGCVRVRPCERQVSGSVRAVAAAQVLIELPESGGRFAPDASVTAIELREP
ncbi:MAG: molybdopterin molybdenumtransferase MoeA [Planctomycetota bacterium]|nr:MAG: molybdopterin molybdenumtransferase MoeA [Planctomycetota bacterium]